MPIMSKIGEKINYPGGRKEGAAKSKGSDFRVREGGKSHRKSNDNIAPSSAKPD